MSHSPPRQTTFLHLKFFSGRPPAYAARIPFAHDLKQAIERGDKTVLDGLPEGLKTDVQREGIARYLRNNFRDGTPVHAVIHERESDSRYIMVNSNWHRSVGDSKLHLSLYVYEKDKHVETWHAYTDRSLSLDNPTLIKGENRPVPTEHENNSPRRESSHTPQRNENHLADDESDVDSRLNEDISSVPPSPESKFQSREAIRGLAGQPVSTLKPDLNASRTPLARESKSDEDESERHDKSRVRPPLDVDHNVTAHSRATNDLTQSETQQDGHINSSCPQRRRKDPSPIVKSRPLGQIASRDRKSSSDQNNLVHDNRDDEVRQTQAHRRGRSRATRNRGMNFGHAESRVVMDDDDESAERSDLSSSLIRQPKEATGRSECGDRDERNTSDALEGLGENEQDLEDEIREQVRKFEQQLREKANRNRLVSATRESAHSQSSDRPARQQTMRNDKRNTAQVEENLPARSRYRQPSRARSARAVSRPAESQDEALKESENETKRAERVRQPLDNPTRPTSMSLPQPTLNQASVERPRRHRSVSRRDRHPSDDSHDESFDPETVMQRKASPPLDEASNTQKINAAGAASSWFSNVSKSVNGLISKAREASAVKPAEDTKEEMSQQESEDEEERRQKRRAARRAARSGHRKVEDARAGTGAETDEAKILPKNLAKSARGSGEDEQFVRQAFE
ncbi:hypothetical protein OIV83_005781 [Microbotryomycetes sp. JL201]|nr:hypothetical protein OIV83_005781 [Microbotryomycetes sp. JL201]